MSETEAKPEADHETERPQEATPKRRWGRRQQSEHEGFTFTDPGCRTELRCGALLVLAAVFLWQWWLELAQVALVVGTPLLLIGVPWQAWDARRHGRPGYPWKLALAMSLIGLALLPDQFYRETVDGPLRLVWPWVPVLVLCGFWMLAWWPLARPAQVPEHA